MKIVLSRWHLAPNRMKIKDFGNWGTPYLFPRKSLNRCGVPRFLSQAVIVDFLLKRF